MTYPDFRNADGSSPSWPELSRRLSAEYTRRGEWAGIPLPLPGLSLVLESKHPAAALLAEVQQIVDTGHPREPSLRVCTDDDLGWREINRWRGRLRGIDGDISINRHEDGRTAIGFDPYLLRRNKFLLGPISTLDAWHLDTELTAIDKLATLIPERMFRAYILTGGFLERSRRSDLTYFFRRCRPTIAISPRARDGSDELRILCCLCLHPLGYYANTFSGAMVPTDDVIAHLLLMRGDEPMFWRRANQHSPLAPEAGL